VKHRLKQILRAVIGECGIDKLRQIYASRKARECTMACCDYDARRMINFSGACNHGTRGAALSEIIATYHIVEKGLTMPHRRLAFGRSAVLRLLRNVDEYESRYGKEESQIIQAASVVVEYWLMHRKAIEDGRVDFDERFMMELEDFVQRHDCRVNVGQTHITREMFYKDRNSDFAAFSKARHTLRHYENRELTVERIAGAIKIALSTPSACNRQYCRVHCITDKAEIKKLLEIQDGNRGFGDDADKLLIVTADMEGLLYPQERNDLYVNGGMFLMNLCYALYYHEIAHCVLNWSKTESEDLALRNIIAIKPSETVIAILTCGETPEEFDVAASLKKNIDEILVVH